MVQKVFGDFNGKVKVLKIPNPHSEILPGVIWGRYDTLFTPAFWAVQTWLNNTELNCDAHRLGETFIEEMTACLLGGYGIPAEIGLAAYNNIKNSETLFKQQVTEEEIFSILNMPIPVNGKMAKYRFARQKAKYLSAAINKYNEEDPPIYDELKLREWLLKIPGIGYKTSAWIVRNHLCSDNVAIIDIHIFRAGVLAGFFDLSCKIQKNYLKLEQQFLYFSKAIGAKASSLDSVIWHNMRLLNKTAIGLIGAH